MARLLSLGYELNSNLYEWSSTSANHTVQSTVVRSGTYAGRTNLSAQSGQIFTLAQSSAQLGLMYYRVYVYIGTAPSSEAKLFRVFGTTTGTPLVGIRVETDRTLQLWNEEDGAQVGSASAALTLNQWYCIELSVDTTTLASTALEARVDGSSFTSGTINLAGGQAGIGVGASDNETLNIYYDDIAVNSSTGSFQNSWPGSGKIIRLNPNAAGDNTAWTNTYTNVDDVTPDDATTLIASNTNNQISDFNVDDPSGIASNATINCVQVGVRFRLDDATSTDPTYVVRAKAAASGTVEESSTISPTSTTWMTNATADPRITPLILYDLPGASTTAWATADLTTAQIGVRETLTDTHNVNVTILWLGVDYTNPLISTLTDNFNDNSLAAHWTDAGAANTNETNSQMEITTDAGSAGAYFVIHSVANYDLTGSELYVELVDAGNQSLASLDAGIQIEKADLTGDDGVIVFIENNNLYLRRRSGASNSDTSIAYSSTDHRWLRISESAGTISIDTAPDGTTWTNRRTFSNPFTDITNVKLSLFAGTWASEGSGSLVIYDNVNVAPGGGTPRRMHLTMLGIG